MTYEQFLENFKNARKQKGMSLQDLAKAVNLSSSYLSLMERGKNTMSVERFLKICDAMYIEPKIFFDENGQHFNEYTITASRLKALPEREFRVLKDLVMLLSLSNEDL